MSYLWISSRPLICLIGRADCLDASAMADVQGRIKDKSAREPLCSRVSGTGGDFRVLGPSTAIPQALTHHDHDHDHDHDHHDHSHVEMVGSNVRVEGRLIARTSSNCCPTSSAITRWSDSRGVSGCRANVSVAGPDGGSAVEQLVGSCTQNAWRPRMLAGWILLGGPADSAEAAVTQALQRLVNATHPTPKRCHNTQNLKSVFFNFCERGAMTGAVLISHRLTNSNFAAQLLEQDSKIGS